VTIAASETVRRRNGARINFETITSAGHRPEPIEVAAVWLTARDGTLGRDNRSFQAAGAFNYRDIGSSPGTRRTIGRPRAFQGPAIIVIPPPAQRRPIWLGPARELRDIKTR
jgi:hypothetical protein